MGVVNADEILDRATNESNRIIATAREILNLILNLSQHYVNQLTNIYEDFIMDLERDVLDIDSYIKDIYELEKDIQIDIGLLEEILKEKNRELVTIAEKINVNWDDSATSLFLNLPTLLKRIGCRLGRPDVVILGIALGHAYGGAIRESFCALLASAAAGRGRWRYVAEIGRRCLQTDLETEVKVICGLAKLVEEYKLDVLGGLSDALEDVRRE
ncbi:hypothetical protein [Pyrobaculum sp.]|uniref:hypothetical protein n=1 Tax=Pyrobaculum sp. TaxID=2004705 RepID=UPI003D14F06D